ncbi:MAG: tRNA uridine-5-carboxymethylaminomethyl(34) synthesis GTPase MnmE [Atopococcus tabaci]|uniref:tRNA modification GTPase MnmE n=1 Tax=Atopococcus tabaci TaxID=269774 RepID=A0AA43RLL6_9LACT|nr:tRNA uridine-5-carboxymethylaminomethyl(34) synthesis GTPase MnmE [Atopococcus tabaci]
MATDFDTIAAISTPPGEGGIGIVRISGEDALSIADKLYRMKGKKLSQVDSHTIHYGHLIDPKTDQILDEVMVTVLKGPKTYTREDIVEINTHGGMLVINQVLQTILSQGARAAQPGEFTKRAFLNGRIDLSQAEAVMDVIESKTEASKSNAFNQLSGDLSAVIQSLRQEILNVLAQVEVNIDYPEYDEVEEMTSSLLMTEAEELLDQITSILSTAQQGRILREGLKTTIIGRPNVGKSSLLNRLLGEEKAIVTDIEGTTRDIVEDYVNVRGVPLKLIDTAGIRETDDAVEKIGVERSRQAIKEADLILFVLDQSQALNPTDHDLMKLTQDENRILVLNKSDLETAVSLEEIKDLAGNSPVISTSMTNQSGIDDLEEAIAQLFFQGETIEKDANYVSNTRHISLLKETQQSLEDVITGLEMGMPVDLVQIDMTHAWETLGEITGETMQDELLNELFSSFCLGK